MNMMFPGPAVKDKNHIMMAKKNVEADDLRVDITIKTSNEKAFSALQMEACNEKAYLKRQLNNIAILCDSYTTTQEYHTDMVEQLLLKLAAQMCVVERGGVRRLAGCYTPLIHPTDVKDRFHQLVLDVFRAIDLLVNAFDMTEERVNLYGLTSAFWLLNDAVYPYEGHFEYGEMTKYFDLGAIELK